MNSKQRRNANHQKRQAVTNSLDPKTPFDVFVGKLDGKLMVRNADLSFRPFLKRDGGLIILTDDRKLKVHPEGRGVVVPIVSTLIDQSSHGLETRRVFDAEVTFESVTNVYSEKAVLDTIQGILYIPYRKIAIDELEVAKPPVFVDTETLTECTAATHEMLRKIALNARAEANSAGTPINVVSLSEAMSDEGVSVRYLAVTPEGGLSYTYAPSDREPCAELCALHEFTEADKERVRSYALALSVEV